MKPYTVPRFICKPLGDDLRSISTSLSQSCSFEYYYKKAGLVAKLANMNVFANSSLNFAPCIFSKWLD